jgi:serine kinase of HPr protein (carbohydrate metabolism regulator)
MATLNDLKEKLQLSLLTENFNADRPVTSAYVCDLLSWVMAHGQENMAWVTVQTHVNVLAIASLHGFACVIIPEGIKVPEETIKKAKEEEITIFSSDKTGYGICCGLANLGIGEK